MLFRSTGAAALMLSMFAAGLAHAAAPDLHVTESITINASAADVWKRVKDFDKLNTWHPAVAKDEIVAGHNNHPGAQRLLTLQDGGTIKEELQKFNDAGRSYTYRIVEGVLPVSSYVSTVSVKPAGKGKATVMWNGHFKRKNTGDNPGEKENDATATNTITAVYRAGLENLKKNAEAGK